MRAQSIEADLLEGAARTPTIGSYFCSFSPAPRWEDLPYWPPDVFALTNLVLDHTQGYRFVVAPPRGGRWPPAPNWNQQVVSAARAWAAAVEDPAHRLPALVDDCWSAVSRARNMPIDMIHTGEAWNVCEALLTLHAVADESCAWLSAPAKPGGCAKCEAHGWELLGETGSLSRVSPSRIRVVPKGRFTNRGITIRSLSRYLALCYESVDLRWNRVGPDPEVATSLSGRDNFNLVLIPWPLTVRAADFRRVATPLGNMDEDHFGFFEFAPTGAVDMSHLGSLLRNARHEMERLDAVVMPEAALEAEDIGPLEDLLEQFGATMLIAGVRTRRVESAFGRNYLHLGVRAVGGWAHLEQDKHHRWCLDGRQIHQYHLAKALDPKKLWWEAVDIHPRALHVIDFGGGATTAPLVCEDLAQMDEVSDVLRRIGPSVVIAVLLDGPQIPSRWPCRYACVLSEEPGSAVLTLTSFGMAARSKPAGFRKSRAIALWRSSAGTGEQIDLARGADAVAITLSVSNRSVWTADGRCHTDVPFITLSRRRQLSASRTFHPAGDSPRQPAVARLTEGNSPRLPANAWNRPRRQAGPITSTSLPSGSST